MDSLTGVPTNLFPEFDERYPLNLSILLSGGKETNRDVLISGERNGQNSMCETAAVVLCTLDSGREQVVGVRFEYRAMVGDSPVYHELCSSTVPYLESRFLRMKRKLVVIFIIS